MFSRAIVPSFVRKIIRRGIGSNGPSLRWRMLYPLSYKKLRSGSSKAGFEPATGRSEVTVAFATGEVRYFDLLK
jgi:hypothetical protein